MKKTNERTVANIYKDTRELLNDFKTKYELKSDDQAIRFLCHSFDEEKGKMLKTYLEVKKGKKGESQNDE
ncbi:hypothetical protein [Virgibacillus pantothenticus]|uniref:hypothetical protein n=1 Tax=Virgibacillus pantothenticus TaxID=1473 RepID=UPI000984AF8F|nr:hypothetical protein [Virgibacillus pantothenticus]